MLQYGTGAYGICDVGNFPPVTASQVWVGPLSWYTEKSSLTYLGMHGYGKPYSCHG